MVDVTNFINQDLSVAIKYINEKKYDSVNIIGNRILQNLYAINKKELMTIGLIVKEVSFDLQQINASEHKSDKKIEKCRSIAIECIQKLIRDDRHSNIEIWNSYFDFEDKIRKYLLVLEEREIYKANHEYSTEATKNYINILSKNKNYLLNRNINPLGRTRSELASMIHIHGGKIPTLFYLLTRAFEHVYRFSLHGKVPDEELESIVNLNINRLNEIVELINEDNNDELVEHANNMIGDLMLCYRKYFMLFGDLKGELIEEIPLSPEVTQKIRKIIDKQTS